jgi:hypothetical protein
VASHDRRSASFTRGTVCERYEARAEGLEQSFVFGSPPLGDGDLVVHLRVATDLVPAAPADDGSLRWRAPGLGAVTFGTVTGVDARGWRVPGQVRRTPDGLDLVLPDAFLDEGAYPLTLDPLIGSSVEAFPGADCDFPDAAYDPWSNSYCVVWTQFLSSNQSGVVGSVFDADTLAFAYAFGIPQSGNQDSIRTASIGGLGVYALFWCNALANGIKICGLALEPTMGAASPIVTIYGPAAVDTPACSSEATSFDDDCLVVWDDAQYGIVGCTFEIDQHMGVTLSPPVVVGGGSTATEPAISKQGGGPGLHVVTWIDRPQGLPGWVRAQVVDHDLNLIGPGAWLQNSAPDAGHPALDGDGFLFLCAWDEQEVANPSARDVRGRTFTVGPAGITSLGPVLSLAGRANDLDGAPDVAMLGDRFGLVWQTATAGAQAFTDDVSFRALARAGTAIGGEHRLERTALPRYVHEHAPRLVGRRDGDYQTTADDGLVVFADQNNQNAESDVGLQAVESMGPGGPVTDVGGGCGPAGLAVGNGAFALGNADFRFELYGAPPLAIPFVSVGFPGPVQSCGVCTITAPVSFDFRPSTAGAAVAQFPIPGDPVYLGVTLEFQWVLFGAAYVGCPLAPGLVASHRIRAQVGH